jgi:hypothetical protein
MLFGALVCAGLPIFAQTTCTSTLSGPTITGNVDVPVGAWCNLNGITVNGGITVEGALYAYGLQVNGPVTATGINALLLLAPNDTKTTTVEGDVTLNGVYWFRAMGTDDVHVQVNGSIIGTGGTNDSEFTVWDTDVAGNLTVSGHNSAYIVNIWNAKVGMNAAFNSNIGAGVRIIGTQITKNLNCGSNSAVVGQGNTVGQHANGQCSSIPGLIVTPPPAPAH